jgi:outer membrane receptor protein involved in Fe transport
MEGKQIFVLSMVTLAVSQAVYGADDQQMTLEPVVVTSRRVETKLNDAPQRIEVVKSKDIDKTFQNDLTDLLKKNASVDVIQYPGGLSGIGIRGFTPEYGGINKRSVLLIDGRPVSADNLATINSGSIEQVEVMKGPGSALYGSGAMGGVVSMVSRQSRGDIRGQANLSLGQFSTSEAKLRAGGNITQSLDFDYAGSLIKAGDFKLGNGQVRSATGYEMDNHSIRGGLDINNEWRLVGKWKEWKGRDVYSPGDLAYGTNAQQRKQMANSDRDLQLTGRMGNHSMSATVFSGTQFSESATLTSTTALYRPQLPAVSFIGNLSFSGWQAQDAWAWSDGSVLLFGIDNQKAKSESRLFNLAVAGVPEKAPGTANNQRISTGVFAENSWAFNEGNSTAYVGIRRDNITVETLYTPLKTGFTPSKTDFTATNPSAGFKHLIAAGWNLHATIGKAFVAPDALYVTGNHQTPRTLPGGAVVIDTTTGNPNIRPENSLSKDIGVEWSAPGFSVDLTVFDTKVKDKIVAVKTTNPDQSVATTYTNAQDGSIQGIELQSRWAFARNYKLTLGGTQYFHDWTMTNNQHVDANVVPKQAFKIALDADHGPWTGRLSARYRGRMKDQDWVTGGGRQVEFGGFTVADLDVRYRIDKAQTVALSVENLTDRFYTEKFGYNMSGRNMRANYRYEF